MINIGENLDGLRKMIFTNLDYIYEDPSSLTKPYIVHTVTVPMTKPSGISSLKVKLYELWLNMGSLSFMLANSTSMTENPESFSLVSVSFANTFEK